VVKRGGDWRRLVESEPDEKHDARSAAHHTLVRCVRPGAGARERRAELGILVTGERNTGSLVSQDFNSREGKIDGPEVRDVQLIREMDPSANPDR
jgi:hypothetical protein